MFKLRKPSWLWWGDDFLGRKFEAPPGQEGRAASCLCGVVGVPDKKEVSSTMSVKY